MAIGHRAAAVAVGLVLASSPGALAAVRSCAAPLASELTRAPTEAAGKRQALASWTAKAQKIGPGYTSWRLAGNRVLGCTKSRAAEGFECIAYAQPCTVSQVPSVPKRRLRPLGRNVPFEV